LHFLAFFGPTFGFLSPVFAPQPPWHCLGAPWRAFHPSILLICNMGFFSVIVVWQLLYLLMLPPLTITLKGIGKRQFAALFVSLQ